MIIHVSNPLPLGIPYFQTKPIAEVFHAIADAWEIGMVC